MNEDIRFNQLVKDALESAPAFSFHPQTAKARVRPWLAATLLAASLAVVVVFRTALSPTGEGAQPTSAAADVVQAIGLLSAIDERTLAADTSDELLLAWQDAPCAGLLNDTVW